MTKNQILSTRQRVQLFRSVHELVLFHLDEGELNEVVSELTDVIYENRRLQDIIESAHQHRMAISSKYAQLLENYKRVLADHQQLLAKIRAEGSLYELTFAPFDSNTALPSNTLH
jgi:hypothetical protein